MGMRQYFESIDYPICIRLHVCVAGMDGQTVNAENDATRFAMVTTGSPKPDSQPSSERALKMRWMLNDRIQAFITRLPGKDTRQWPEMACWPGKADANTLHGAGGWTSILRYLT
ncbi:hypothetical protein CXU01_08155 [Akkermansia muciniphila]|nr:hypothetical protein CXU01_08155 [Akkermansia muciniphila]